ncbi:hypothetical protein NEOLI_000266 [Neolecta irregularis DAH-3]|uniref:Uncharacterized protein n=1 Tax=Neolecta irregularis (strain DAH-3) TaxID=1198029 RepID=A0A1U7LV36_NEOID|nr:hypothetical protein NEOLI_000266 [Neolecta irregularis DAH-3]|eukprot:OLL26545.1 hypothetical protein NEOLI_000266 [Neolecta irregularis DAH-3]
MATVLLNRFESETPDTEKVHNSSNDAPRTTGGRKVLAFKRSLKAQASNFHLRLTKNYTGHVPKSKILQSSRHLTVSSRVSQFETTAALDALITKSKGPRGFPARQFLDGLNNRDEIPPKKPETPKIRYSGLLGNRTTIKNRIALWEDKTSNNSPAFQMFSRSNSCTSGESVHRTPTEHSSTQRSSQSSQGGFSDGGEVSFDTIKFLDVHSSPVKARLMNLPSRNPHKHVPVAASFSSRKSNCTAIIHTNEPFNTLETIRFPKKRPNLEKSEFRADSHDKSLPRSFRSDLTTEIHENEPLNTLDTQRKCSKYLLRADFDPRLSSTSSISFSTASDNEYTYDTARRSVFLSTNKSVDTKSLRRTSSAYDLDILNAIPEERDVALPHRRLSKGRCPGRLHNYLHRRENPSFIANNDSRIDFSGSPLILGDLLSGDLSVMHESYLTDSSFNLSFIDEGFGDGPDNFIKNDSNVPSEWAQKPTLNEPFSSKPFSPFPPPARLPPPITNAPSPREDNISAAPSLVSRFVLAVKHIEPVKAHVVPPLVTTDYAYTSKSKNIIEKNLDRLYLKLSRFTGGKISGKFEEEVVDFSPPEYEEQSYKLSKEVVEKILNFPQLCRSLTI